MGEVNHESRKHALLSASGASRWLNCTPSARLEEKFQESNPMPLESDYAAEGTLAHEFGEVNLRLRNKEITSTVYVAETKKLRAHKLYSPEMDGEVEKYVTAVMEAFAVAKNKTPDAKLLIEQHLDFSHIVEKGFGTGDACVISDGVLDIMDLKYGKGIVVDATENEQLMLYGIGALRKLDMSYDIETVRLTIIQPRLDWISSWEISAEALRTWGEEFVKPKAVSAYSGEGEQLPGDHCKWCKVKPMCKALAEMNMDLVKHDFQDPQLVDEADLIGIFKQQPMLVDWVNSVAEYILNKAIQGKKWEGYKLVEGRSNRKWLDEQKVTETLIANQFTPDKFMKTSLSGITDIEKVVGKKKFSELLSSLIIKPPGKPTLVPEGDKRPSMDENSKEDFND